MRERLWIVTALGGLVCLAFAMLAYGGAARLAPAVAAQARAEAPVTQTYIVLERYAVRALPALANLSQGLARACFAEALQAIRDDPELALHLLAVRAQGPWAPLARFASWAAPLLFALSVLLYAFRPRPIHLIRP